MFQLWRNSEWQELRKGKNYAGLCDLDCGDYYLYFSSTRHDHEQSPTGAAVFQVPHLCGSTEEAGLFQSHLGRRGTL